MLDLLRPSKAYYKAFSTKCRTRDHRARIQNLGVDGVNFVGHKHCPQKHLLWFISGYLYVYRLCERRNVLVISQAIMSPPWKQGRNYDLLRLMKLGGNLNINLASRWAGLQFMLPENISVNIAGIAGEHVLKLHTCVWAARAFWLSRFIFGSLQNSMILASSNIFDELKYSNLNRQVCDAFSCYRHFFFKIFVCLFARLLVLLVCLFVCLLAC